MELRMATEKAKRHAGQLRRSKTPHAEPKRLTPTLTSGGATRSEGKSGRRRRAASAERGRLAPRSETLMYTFTYVYYNSYTSFL